MCEKVIDIHLLQIMVSMQNFWKWSPHEICAVYPQAQNLGAHSIWLGGHVQ